MGQGTLDQIDVREKSSLPGSSTERPCDRICTRCGGLLVTHICLDLQNSANELECTAMRCVQCGDIVDSVILRNRGLGHAPYKFHSPGSPASSLKSHIRQQQTHGDVSMGASSL